MFSNAIIFIFVTILEIDSSKIFTGRETHSPTVFLPHRGVSSTQSHQSPSVEKFFDPPEKFRHIDAPYDLHYRTKKFHHSPNPVEYKKTLYTKRFKHRGTIPRIIRPVGKLNNNEDKKNLDNSKFPSLYLVPPSETNVDHLYYERNKKSMENQDKVSNGNSSVEGPRNHRLEYESANDTKIEGPVYSRDHAPEQQVDATDDEETNDNEHEFNEKTNNSAEKLKDRIEFHVHGHAGPETYMFGYDTGDGDNRQYRMEERHGDGTVTGHYGYIDARGKLRKVHYKASPTRGYEEKHHEID